MHQTSSIQFKRGVAGTEKLGSHFHRKKRWKSCGLRNKIVDSSFIKMDFFLSVFIWYDILFQVNKASKILQSYGVSFHTMETEIQATEKFLQNYRTTGYDGAATSAVEIAQELDIDPSFPPSRSGKKRRLFDYQGEEEQRATTELKFKSNFFYPLVDQAIMSIKERFNLLREVSSAFSFLYTRDKLFCLCNKKMLFLLAVKSSKKSSVTLILMK